MNASGFLLPPHDEQRTEEQAALWNATFERIHPFLPDLQSEFRFITKFLLTRAHSFCVVPQTNFSLRHEFPFLSLPTLGHRYHSRSPRLLKHNHCLQSILQFDTSNFKTDRTRSFSIIEQCCRIPPLLISCMNLHAVSFSLFHENREEDKRGREGESLF